MIIENYPHKQGLHCETGSLRNMLNYYKLDISEEMIFGIGSGYDFIYFPFPLFEGTEAPLLRNTPGKITSNLTKRMKIDCVVKKYSNQDKAMKELDELLEKGYPVGMVVDISLLPFFLVKGVEFPAHTIVILGKEGDEYIVCDIDYHFPDDSLHRILAEDLKKARFPTCKMSPKGKCFYIKAMPEEIDLKKVIIKGIKDTCYQMLDIPIPFFGVKGIYFYSKRLRTSDKRYGEAGTKKNLERYLLMAEEAGTGGSGYRYMFQVFLKEAAEYLKDDELLALSVYQREVGDKWKEYGLETLRQTKDRNIRDINLLADIVYSVAQMEEKLFTDLRKWVKKQ